MEAGSYADWVAALANVAIASAAICAAALGYRGLNAWRTETIGKRKAELAEQVLADFYEAQDVFRFARQPFTYSNEGNTRQKEEGETAADTQRLNTYFTVSERLLKRNECFANLHARQYRFLALFGHDSEQIRPFDNPFRIRNEVILAVNMLMTSYKQRRLGDPPVDPKLREKWESAIGWREPENDAIALGLDDVVKAIEKICRPAIEETEKSR